ncbi:hypothetical protein ACQKNC_08750 [Lysinibacillus sp. NPDC094177]|uniref:hypothetical protein n=1 Tax=Lysinibacillus sp. NPDC094177 TaxID=3390580 RepID=UPI003CFF905F
MDSKKQQLRKPTPINVVCVKDFRQLERYTSELRKEADAIWSEGKQTFVFDVSVE